MKKTLNKIKKIGVHGLAFAFVVYSVMISFFVISMIVFAMVRNLELLPILLTLILSATAATFYYFKMFPEGSEIRSQLIRIINPYGKIKPGNLQAGVFGLFMALTLHVSSFLMPGTIIETIVIGQTQAFGYLLMYSVIILVTTLVIFLVSAWIARKLYNNTLIPAKPAIAILILSFVANIITIALITPVTETYQPVISQIGLLVIGSIPIGILSVLFRPGSYLE
ncbi:hypothetical protein KC573_04010 [candidate division WWE3 bacterium]|uniref:Uncharacterized protein n=1 Tax=candidate division WWE3 bacterium TaxID=2053526 RepID=A0A955LXE9_UNCKA|nr:hypothetical protein [candidate division WWE3 bacterium]